MAVARILSDSASDAAPLAAHLHALGYTIEIASPTSDAESHADLEIRLDRCSSAEALAMAEQRARELGADVYISSGAFGRKDPEITPLEAPVKAPAPLPIAQVQPALREEIRNPLSPAVAMNAATESQSEILATQPAPAAHQAEVAESSPGPIFGSATVPEPIDSAATYTLFGDRIPGTSETANDESDQRENAWAAAASETTAAMRDSLQAARNSVDRAVTSLASSFTALASSTRQWCSRQTTNWRQAVEQRRASRAEAQQQRALALQSRRAVEEAPAEAAPKAIATPASAAATRAIPLRTGRPLPWLAFAGAGALAVAAMLGWSVLAGHPASPGFPVNGTIEQHIPFGPVKIVPRAAAPQSVAPKPAQPVQQAHAPAPPAAAPVRQPQRAETAQAQPVQHHRVARNNIADDEVIVHHYNAPKPPQKAQISSTGVRHISDQE